MGEEKMNNGMVAVFGGISLEHNFFDYLHPAEKADIQTRLDNGSSWLVVFMEGNTRVYAAVIDCENDRIHARELAGNFPKLIKYAHALCHALARKFDKKYVSFCASRDAVKRIGKKLGYSPNENGEFEMERI